MTQEIQAHKVTKPIQLLAAWLLGLIAINGAFLTAANLLSAPKWAAAVLVIAAVVNVPVFLVCIFLLQTRFRPEMQEDSYYSKYLAVQQQTLKVSSSEDQISKLSEMLVLSQTRLTEGLAVLDTGVREIRAQLPEIESASSTADIQDVILTSERVLEEARSRLRSDTIDVEVNDLLERYPEILASWRGSRIRVKNTFGSNSENPTRPVYPVIAFENGVEAYAMIQVCQSLKGFADWYIHLPPWDLSTGRIYVGAYGYGGGDVALLTDELLAEMAGQQFSMTTLKQWIGQNAVSLDADYVKGPALQANAR